MTIFFITLALFLIVFAAMSIGYIVQQKSLAGSCGGLASVGVEKACNCDKPCEKRIERERVAAEQKNEHTANRIDVTNI